MPEFSIVTIVKGRRKQLANLLQSVSAATFLPNDVQVVCMDDPQDISTPDGLNVSINALNQTHALPLAAARNKGIAAARTERVIFIDVDCLVSPTLFENMLAALQADNIIAAYPLYLPILPDNGNYNELKPLAIPHPAREHIPSGEPVEHLQFWSLIFAIQKEAFDKIGGFDESFIGYGAEDTDFAMTFHQAGIQQIFIGDYVLHQYHEKYDPPLNHFESIIENARRYQEKWGVLPMRKWLRKFAEMGLINVNAKHKISIVKYPSATDMKNNLSMFSY